MKELRVNQLRVNQLRVMSDELRVNQLRVMSDELRVIRVKNEEFLVMKKTLCLRVSAFKEKIYNVLFNELRFTIYVRLND